MRGVVMVAFLPCFVDQREKIWGEIGHTFNIYRRSDEKNMSETILFQKGSFLDSVVLRKYAHEINGTDALIFRFCQPIDRFFAPIPFSQRILGVGVAPVTSYGPLTTHWPGTAALGGLREDQSGSGRPGRSTPPPSLSLPLGVQMVGIRRLTH